VATWTADGVTIHDANQGSHTIRNKVAEVFGLEPERVHVTAPYVGGGFGSKVFVHPHLIAAVMASQAVERSGQARAHASADVLPGRPPDADDSSASSSAPSATAA
jgi:CO/xanthine dehydrogenase Mo-binding subunit